jgi:hypothetical protein
VARLLSRSRETGQATAHYALLREAHCRGFDRGREWSLEQWIENQEVAPYNEMNDRLMEIIAMKNQLFPGPLGLAARQAFQLALYDLDVFRTQVFENGFLRGFAVERTLLEQAETDDEALLQIGLRYVRDALLRPSSENRGPSK